MEVGVQSNPYESPSESLEAESPIGDSPQYYDPRGVTKALKVMLIISLVIAGLSLISDVLQINLIRRSTFALGTSIRSNDNRQLLMAIISFVVGAITSIIYLTWVYRLNKNCHHFGKAKMQFTPGWSVGWHFVPIANLWRPFQVMLELWQVSADPTGSKPRRTAPIVAFWWATRVGTALVGIVASRMFLSANSLSSLETATTLAILADGLMILSSAVTIVLVAALTAKQLPLVDQHAPPADSDDSKPGRSNP